MKYSRRAAASRPRAAAGSQFFELLEGRRLMSAATSAQSVYQAPVYAAVEAVDATRPTITNSDPTAGKTDVSRDVFVAAYVHLPNVGQGVKDATLSTSTVKLYKSSDATKTSIAGNINTTGGGDAIVFTPTALLDANTAYTFEVTAGVTDTSGKAFYPYTTAFTTGTKGTPVATTIGFDKVELPTASGKQFTGVTIGPDGKLYAGSFSGEIYRWDIKSDGTLSSGSVINTVRVNNGNTNRIVTGITFDPTSTADNLILWVTNNDGAEIDAPGFTGKLARLTGPNLENYQDYVVGLPRSVRDHLSNQIAFDSQNRLYFSQGSINSLGAPDSAWGLREDVLLSGAILRVDYPQIATRLAAGLGPVDVKTADGGTYDPYAPNAPVIMYATGVRNAYDLLWHSNGNLYAPTNGSATGGNSPAGGGAPALTNLQQNEPDWLFKIRKDKYYGHPNPTRGQYVLNGGNPTAGPDKYEVDAYPVGTQPDDDWEPAVYSFGDNRSPDGIIEYKSNAFGGQLKGAMLVVRYSGGDDIIVLRPDANGNIPTTGVQTGIPGTTGFADPLDLTEQVSTGNIYVIEYASKKITLLRAQTPATDDPTPPTPPTPVAPAAPAGLAATLASESSIVLNWTDGSNDETSFEIQRAVNGAAFTTLVSVAANVTTYTDGGLLAGASYQYRIRAVNAVGPSAYIASTAVATPAAPTPVDPTPVDPTPVDPTPVDPTPVDPTPVDPTPTDPEPTTPPGSTPPVVDTTLAEGVTGTLPAQLVGASKVKANVSVFLANRSLSPISGPVTTQLYLSADGAVDGSDAQIATLTKNLKLVPGRGKSVKLKVSQLPGVAEGQYQLLAQVVRAGASAEVIASTSTFHVAQGFVELKPGTPVSPSAPLKPGSTGRLKLAIQNLGNIRTEAGAMVSVVAVPSVAGASEIDLGTVPVKLKLNPSQAANVAVKFDVPFSLPAGSYQLMASVSSNDIGAGGVVESGLTPVIVL